MKVQTGLASSSNLQIQQQNTSKLLALNQNRFEDYLVSALNDSLMKKSKYFYNHSFTYFTNCSFYRRYQMPKI